MPVRLNVNVSDTIKKQLRDYVNDLDDGILTKKGYRVNSWKLLEPVTPESLLEEFKKLQEKLNVSEITEAEHCTQIINILENGLPQKDNENDNIRNSNCEVQKPENESNSGKRSSQRFSKNTLKTADETKGSVDTEAKTRTRSSQRLSKSAVDDDKTEESHVKSIEYVTPNTSKNDLPKISKDVKKLEKGNNSNVNGNIKDKAGPSGSRSEISSSPKSSDVKVESEDVEIININELPDSLKSDSGVSKRNGLAKLSTQEGEENVNTGESEAKTGRTAHEKSDVIAKQKKLINIASSSENGMISRRDSPRSSRSKTDSKDENVQKKTDENGMENCLSGASKPSSANETDITQRIKVKENFDEASKEIKRKSEDPIEDPLSKKRKSTATKAKEDTKYNKKEAEIEEIEEDKENEESSDEQEEKKIKIEEKKKKRISLKVTHPTKPPVLKCNICHQVLDSDLKLYPGHPTGAVEEYVALTDTKLSLFTGEEDYVTEYDSRPQNKITHFNVYDKEGHLCPFDSGLIEKNVYLYFSGYLKPVYEENSLPDGGVPTKDLGPINEWWISGFDGGESALVGFSTAYGEYYLMEPTEDYAPFMNAMKEKIFLSKIVIETVADDINTTYEDLLNVLQTTVPPAGLSTLTEDNLLRHAQFVCDQISSFDSTAFENEDLLVTSPCVRSLVNLSGVTFGKRKAMRQMERKDFKRIQDTKWSKATTTPLVKDVFETFFTDQLDKENDKENKGPRRRRCGVCESCQQPDCGTCTACRDMLKFGGTGKSKQACIQRRCPNMAIQEADDSENEDEEFIVNQNDTEYKTQSTRGSKVRDTKRVVEWVGEPLKKELWRTIYSAAKVGNEDVHVNDCVLVESKEASTPFYVGRVVSMWEDNFGGKSFHCWWFIRGTNTVLGETSDPNELFLVDECENCLLSIIFRKATVVYCKTSEDWSKRGSEEQSDNKEFKNSETTFFFQKRYDPKHARFEDPLPDETCDLKTNEVNKCCVCRHNFKKNKEYAIFLENKLEETSKKEISYGLALWKGKEFRPGNCVFLAPGTLKFKKSSTTDVKKSSNDREIDEDLYPEFYRKSSDHIKGSNEETPSPFCIGFINAIFTRSDSENHNMNAQNIFMRVNKFYRPENTHKAVTLGQQLDLNLLYWSDEEVVLPFSSVTGKCNVIFSENVDVPIAEWSMKGTHRFYFTQAYDAVSQTFLDPPTKATNIGKPAKGKGKGKGKGKSSVSVEEKKKEEKIEDWPKISHKLRSLDVFAGCGGLSEGLHQSGVAESCWAIEKEEAAAYAFKLNNPKCTVFTEDCNALLKLVMMGENKNEKGQTLPKKGDVELLCGGPPCQGFSGMNRFNSRQYSLFKNSLIVSFLSYCDYYRPRFFILENVRNFVSFKRNMVLKLTLRCLIKMGYQCTFGILQAGNYGVPQTRRRAIILAAAPGEVLPNFPEPTHVFNLRACQLSVLVDEKKYLSNCEWVSSAPLRTITVRDSMSDLPEIRNGHKREEMSYEGEPLSHFQRLMRGNQYEPILRDHVCKDMAAIIEARISHIPTASGSDWRDLPNIAARLSDGTFTKKLIYTHHDKKNGKSSTGALRGVCSCASGKSCDPMDKQYNTLIPWCLPHTGNRHNHWAGLYGRLEWDGFFSTTVTNPEPMGKQGRVLHPEQTRVVSVRECARSQGFPDTYRFFGTILDKHRQIGNAVPPPMGAAIGYEIRKCVAVTQTNVNDSSDVLINENK